MSTNGPFFRPKAAILYPDVEPHDDTTRVIGRRTTYRGTEHPYLTNREVVVIGVIKYALRGEDHSCLTTEDEVRAAGGVGPFDRVEVSCWVSERQRLSFGASDPKAVDLVAFGPAPP
jgi:hypothetical protein